VNALPAAQHYLFGGGHAGEKGAVSVE